MIHKKREVLIDALTIIILFLSLYVIFISFNKISSITGFFIYEEYKTQSLNYTDNLNLYVNTSSTYNWVLGNSCNLTNCTLSAVRISGSISANQSGSVSIYLEDENNRYLILKKDFELNKKTITQNVTTEENVTFINETTNETITQTINVTQEVNFTIEEPTTFYFEDACIETCNLTGLNKNVYNVTFDLNGNISLRLFSIQYVWTGKIVQVNVKVKEYETKTKNVIESSFDEDVSQKKFLKNWYVEQSGLSDADEACVNFGIWELTNESYTGKKAIKYIAQKDELACGIKLSSFDVDIGKLNIEFYFKDNFTNPDSHFEILNYGENNCDVKFNKNGIIEAIDCEANITTLTDNWKKISITIPILTPEKMNIFLSPPFLLNDNGTIIFDNFSIEMMKYG